ncbi:hypothetical protein PZN02_000871 [Sinorhizobium garamanticum]|uniref:Uncharacterized protein n=1 Tax=Sinorhizobium garamanticum TaxID=680247 RepID=A0ABY8DBY1_9HYPH|nr:hypothetical protein [Sinorhizobium garamanticum]WEX88389.1 hypothetical protein PZN02_000871 [Sinorhizobium garamanticum]
MHHERVRPWFLNLKQALFDRGGLEEIFRHVRNLVVATLVIAAGMHAVEHPDIIDAKGLLSIPVAGYFVFSTGIALFFLNFADGLHRLGKIKRHVALQLLLVAVYVLVTVRVAQLILALRMTPS